MQQQLGMKFTLTFTTQLQTDLLTFRWRDCDVENLYKCLALVTSLDIKTRYGTGYSWDPGLDQNTVWDSRNVNGIHSLSATRKAELTGKENDIRESDDRSSGYGILIKTKRDCGTRTTTPSFQTQLKPTLASFFSRSYISFILSFTVEEFPPSKMPIVLM